MTSRRGEFVLRIVALVLGLVWVLAMGLSSSRNGALAAVGIVLILGAYVGGPIVAVMLSRRRRSDRGWAWAVGAFFMPAIILPLMAFWGLKTAPRQQVQALKRRGDFPGLTRALRQTRTAYTRANAAKALAEIGGLRSIEILLTALGEPEPCVRAAAADGLAQVRWPAEDEGLHSRAHLLLQAALRDVDPATRCAAARALGQGGDPRATDALTRAAGDADEDVRQAVASALDRLASSPA
jgi:hypothetical protein